jgi:hypothetical protein
MGKKGEELPALIVWGRFIPGAYADVEIPP